MAGIKELLRSEADGSLSFGDHSLTSKTKLSDYKFEGDIYKVKTFKEMTRLEKNDNFLFESEPGATVYNMKYTGSGAEFSIEADEDVQLTMGFKEETEYEIFINDDSVGKMMTNLGGKLSFSVELNENEPVNIKIKQV